MIYDQWGPSERDLETRLRALERAGLLRTLALELDLWVPFQRVRNQPGFLEGSEGLSRSRGCPRSSARLA